MSDTKPKLQERELSSTLIDNMPCIALILKVETREIVFSNKEAQKVGAVPGKQCYRTWGQRETPCPWCKAPKAWKTGEAQHVVIKALDIVWDAHWLPVDDDLYLHYAFDITEQTRAEDRRHAADRAVRESEQKFRHLFNNANDAIFLTKLSKNKKAGNFIEVNDVACERLGYSRENMLQMSFKDIDPPHESFKTVKKRFLKKKKATTETVHITKSGKRIPVEINSQLFSMSGKKVILSIARDISERKQVEQERAEFITMTSHELRTPLTSIQGYFDFLKKNFDSLSQTERNKCFDALSRNIRRLKRLVDGVMEISNVERNTFEIYPIKIHLSHFLESVHSLYFNILGEAIVFEEDMTSQDAIFYADEDRLRFVMDNLINNAMKHTSEKNRSIIVKTEAFEKTLTIKVIDNGAGILKKNLNRIFRPFVSIPTDYSVTGSGIGLYISRQTIKAHGGKLNASSKGKNKGATFTITLPLEERVPSNNISS